MTAQEVDERLCTRLAELYPQSESVHTLARRAGVEPTQIRLAGSVADQWAALVQAARTRGATATLIGDALTNEPSDAELNELLAAERNAARQRKRSTSREGAPVSPTSDELLHQVAQEVAVIGRDLHYLKEGQEELRADTRRALEHVPPGYAAMQILLGLLVFVQIVMAIFLVATHT